MSSVPHRPGSLVVALACLAGLAAAPVAAPVAAPGAARAGTAAPGQIIGYAKADRSGASQAWDLPLDKPYLYVPAIPAALGGRIAAVETGPEVGVVLFQGPYFSARDRGCQPALGTTRQPHLAWLGATARFAPAPPGQDGDPPSGPSADADAAQGGYASLIVYRTDLGPPPGALLLDRRATLGLRCANPIHKTTYNRIFVPVAEAPETERCFDLVGNYPGASGPVPVNFVSSDRLVLLMPGDMTDRYAPVRHDITVTLFDGLSCSGRSVSLDSRARLGRDVRLAQMEFRDRARSLRLTYDYGNADAFMVRRETPPPAAVARAAPAESSQDQAPAAPVLAAQPIQDPSIGGAARAPDPSAEPEVQAAQSAPAAVPEPSLGATALAAKSAEPLTAPAMEPEPPAQAAAETPLETPLEAPADAPREAPVEAPAVAPATAPLAAPVGEPVPDRAATQTQTAAPTARTIPKLSPVMTAPETQTAALPSAPKTFAFPVHDLYRLNHCLYWQSDCGQPAAAAWCRAKGYARAVDWAVDKNIGAIFPTVVMGEERVCAQFKCDGFKEITCGP